MRLKHALVITIIASATMEAFANGNPPPEVPSPKYFNLDQSFTLNPVSQSGAISGSKSNAASTSESISKSSSTSQSNLNNNSTISNDAGSSRTYVAPAPSYATPLPANLCPLGNSVAWSFGWNAVSYSSSSTRTELECLERVLAALRPAPQEVKVVEVPKEVVVKIPEIVYVDRYIPAPIPSKKKVPVKKSPCGDGAKAITICEAIKK